MTCKSVFRQSVLWGWVCSRLMRAGGVPWTCLWYAACAIGKTRRKDSRSVLPWWHRLWLLRLQPQCRGLWVRNDIVRKDNPKKPSRRHPQRWHTCLEHSLYRYCGRKKPLLRRSAAGEHPSYSLSDGLKCCCNMVPYSRSKWWQPHTVFLKLSAFPDFPGIARGSLVVCRWGWWRLFLSWCRWLNG